MYSLPWSTSGRRLLTPTRWGYLGTKDLLRHTLTTILVLQLAMLATAYFQMQQWWDVNASSLNFYPWPEYMTSGGLGSAAMKGARDQNKPSWRLMLGSKPIPENFCKGTPESLSYLKAALGIESARDGTHTGSVTYDFSKWIGGCSLERAVGGLRGQGISTRNGLSLIHI